MTRLGLFQHQQSDYAVPLARLRTLLHRVPVFPMPRLPGGLHGVLVFSGELVPVLDLGIFWKRGDQPGEIEYQVLIESEYGTLAIPAQQTCGIVPENKGTITAVERTEPAWLAGRFIYQGRTFRILDIDFLTMGLTQGFWSTEPDTAGSRRFE